MLGKHGAEVWAAVGPGHGHGLVVVSDQLRVRSVPSPPGMLGYADGDDLLGRLLSELIHPDDMAAVVADLRETAGREEQAQPIAVRARHRDGRWVHLSVAIADGRTDPLVGGLAIRISVAKELDDGERELPMPPGMAPLADALSSGILAADTAGRVVYANGASTELFWRDAELLLDQGWLAPIHTDDIEEVRATAQAALAGLTHQDVTFQVWIDADQSRWVHARFSGLDPADRPGGWVAVLEDVSNRRAVEQALAYQATHDALTGLPDRLLLRDRLEQGIARLDRSDARMGVLFIDLDRFKEVNDDHGHGVGDEVLIDVAQRIQAAVRPGDTAARVGGDEFVVVADDVDEARAVAIGERILRAVASPVEVDGKELTMGASIGVTLASPGESVDQILNRADRAMYRAKRHPDHSIELAKGS